MNYFVPTLKDRVYLLYSIDSNTKDPISSTFVINNKAYLYPSKVTLNEDSTFTLEVSNLEIDLTEPYYLVVEDLNGIFYLLNREFSCSTSKERTLNNRKVTFTIYNNYYPVRCTLNSIDKSTCQYSYEYIKSITINDEEELEFLDASFTLDDTSFTLSIVLEDYVFLQYNSVLVTLNTGEQFLLRNVYDSLTRKDNIITLTLITYQYDI